MEVNVYDIDDKVYMLMNELEDNNIHYMLLVNQDDEDDFLFRKVDGDDLVPLDNEDEVVRVIQLFDEAK